MKLLCEVQVLNRNTQITKSSRGKSTLAVGFNSSTKDVSDRSNKTGNELEILLFSAQNKIGQRYKVNNNINKIFTKFINDGKATIGFKQPPENLLIKCDPIQLKGFLQTLKLGMEGKNSINIRLPSNCITAIPQKSQPQKKMIITKRTDYPTKGFPKSLATLKISNLSMLKITPQIYSLYNLNTLDLSENNISQIPIQLGDLSLAQLIVSDNQLGKMNDWKFFQRKPIQKSLKELDLSNNKLIYFPTEILKCENIITLRLDNNQIKRLPFGLRRMRQLRTFHLSSNCLESIPSIFNNMILDDLNFWGNKFESGVLASVSDLKAVNVVPKLWIVACQAVRKHKLCYSDATLPWELSNIISESPVCDCDKLCFDVKILKRASLARFTNVKNLTFSRESSIYADIVLCGQKCSGMKKLVGIASN